MNFQKSWKGIQSLEKEIYENKSYEFERSSDLRAVFQVV